MLFEKVLRLNRKNILLISTSLLVGLMYFLSQPRYNIYILAFLFYLPAHIFWRVHKSISPFFWGGFFSFFITIHWITHAITYYGGFPYIFAILPLTLLSLTLAGFFLLFAYIREKTEKLGLPFSFSDPVIWVAMEFIKSWFLTGFPWALVGYSLWKKTIFIQIADIGGVYAVSFFVITIQGFLCDIIDFILMKEKEEKKKILKRLIFSSSFALFVFAFTLIYGVKRKDEIKKYVDRVKEEIPAVIVQPSIPQDVKWTPDFKIYSLEQNINLSFSAIDFPYSEVILVWPETALTFFFERETELQSKVLELSKKGFFIVAGGIGISEQIKNGRINLTYYNRAYLVEPDGKYSSYDKTHLVIFGEYIPLRSFLEKIPFIKNLIDRVEKVAGDFEPGKEVRAVGEKIRLGIPICFESIFPSIVRKMIQDGAKIIAVITNDGWFGYSSGPYQHFSVSALRAVETRRFVLRSANTGISGAFSPTGDLIFQTKLLEKTSFLVKVKPLDIKTFYVKYGDVFSIACLIITSFFVITHFYLSNFYLSKRKIR
ncbi:MAG: apolipoprotein N-acyltransferase [Candidatus Calescibacterium sp.]